MNFNTILNGAKVVFSKTKFWTKKHSPELLIASGLIGAGAAVILACKATTKLEPITKPANEEIDKIHAKMSDENVIANGEYSVKDGRKELMKVYTKTGWKLIKLYSPAFIAFVLSSSAIIGSNKIMRGREAAVAAAYSAVAAGYRSYRDRVKAAVGEEAEDKIFRNIDKATKTKEVVDPKTGEAKEVSVEDKASAQAPGCDYSILYDCTFDSWGDNGRLNLEWLMMQERYLNQKLKAEGYLFLADVYKALGVPKVSLPEWVLQATHVVGWIYDPKDTTHGDNFVSFGLTNKDGFMTHNALELHNMNETDIWLSFNPDGDILTGNHNKKTFMRFAKN